VKLPALVLVASVPALIAGSIFAGLFERSVVSENTEQPLTAAQMSRLVERGAYVATAADCLPCHTAKGGASWAGGLPLKTPFGTIYSTNISPDKEFGIGNWTRADFHRALRDGIGKGGVHLYPAMPYGSYRNMTRDDVDSVYAYLMTREPVKVKNREHELSFPFNIRRSLTFWNLVNLPSAAIVKDPTRSDVWNHGRYLADALAHCGECHTPRNLMQGPRQSSYLKGGLIDGIEAPDITKEGLTRMGFDALQLSNFMESGLAAQGGMTSQMFDVLHFSTQYLTERDLQALSVYLFDLDSVPDTIVPPPAAPRPATVAPAVEASARRSYFNLCSGCHGDSGQGIPHVVVPLTTNASLRLSSGHNLARTILKGVPAQRFPRLERMQAMPSFGEQLTDEEVADLANWMRAAWGGQEPTVEAKDVRALRKD
jgi:mono/diheme cytochrome c family protein